MTVCFENRIFVVRKTIIFTAKEQIPAASMFYYKLLVEMETSTCDRSLTVNNVLGQAWELTKLYFPPVLILVVVMNFLPSMSNIWVNSSDLYQRIIEATASGETPELDDLGPMALAEFTVGGVLALLLIGLVETYLRGALCHVLVTTVNEQTPGLLQSLRHALRHFLHFLGIYIVHSLCILLGTLCCILPGIFMSVRWLFVPFIAMEHPELPLGETFARSYRMTEGHFGELLWLGIASVFLNILGLLCCCVGIYFTIVITLFMQAVLYRMLKPEETPAPTGPEN